MKQRTKLFSVSIHDCRVDTFCSGGKGGQHQNATQSGVRIVHKPSGAIGECREDRHQINNKRTAFRRMAETKEFVAWVRFVAAEMTGATQAIANAVDESLRPGHLRVETKDDQGRWRVTNTLDDAPLV